MARRKPVSIRLSEAERDVLKAAARKAGTGWTTMLRRAGLDRASNLLARELRQDSGDGDGERE